jgi:uncharacterized protein YneR
MTITDGTTTNTQVRELEFAGTNFYLEGANSRVNLQPIDHGSQLVGLGDDDHTQYSLADGSRAFSGDVTINAGLNVDEHVTLGDTLNVENAVTAEAFYLRNGGEWTEVGFQAIDGEFGAPSFTFQSNNALGLWNQSGTLIIEANDGLKAIDSIGSQIFSADREGFTAGNRVKAEAFYLKGGGDLSADQWLLPDGTQALPSLGLASQPDMGMYKEATDQLTFVIGNEEFLSFDATAIAVKIAKPLLIPDGTAIGPSIRFNSDASTAQSGIYKPGTGEIAIGADETEAMHFSKAGVRTPHKFKAENFYLGRGGDLSDDFITFQIETLSAKNYFIDVSAPYDYEISEVVLRSESGTGIASFYVDPVGGTGAGRYGRPIEGLIDFYITQDKQTFTITPFPIGQGDEWFMGVESVVEARDVAGTVRIRR